MNDYDFKKLSEGSVSFSNLTGRLQKLAESFADIMVDTALIELTFAGGEATAESVLQKASNEDIANGLEELRGSLKSVPDVFDIGGRLSLVVGGGDFSLVMEWGPSEINGIIDRVEQAVEQEVRDGALDASDFDDAVKNMLALAMDNLVGMVEKGEIEGFTDKIDQLADDIGNRLTNEAENGADDEARRAADYLLKEPRYSIEGFFQGLSENEFFEDENEGYYWPLYEDKHPDLITAFADEFGTHGLASYSDLDQFAETSIGQSYRSEPMRIFDNAYETFKETIKDRIADYIEKRFR